MSSEYMSDVRPGELLWQPSSARLESAGVTAFRQWLNRQYQLDLPDYGALWQWSVEELETFWEAVWRYYDIAPGQSYTRVLDCEQMPEANWFDGAQLNFAEYLLRQGDRGDLLRPAIFAESESTGASSLNWRELREQVVRLATHLREAGIEPGDRVVAYLPMSAEAVVAMLACISVGAVWSSCSPDFGARGVLERFGQIEPKLFIAVSGYHYNGKKFDRRKELANVVESLPSLEELIYLPWADASVPEPPSPVGDCRVTLWRDSIAGTDVDYDSFAFEPMPFAAPIWIMYSSGTTGIPKCIVHSQGGILLEFVKYAWLHDDVNPDSVKFFFTTTGWAMFNILVGGMTAGAAIAVYDGSPTYPDNNCLWDLCERYQVSYFGVNPSYVNSLIQAQYSPRANHDLQSIKTIGLTGSPSAPETFSWFYQHVHEDLHVISMSGGTDICGAFVAGASDLPVYAGEIQSPCLGVDVAVFDDAGAELPAGEDGELVIRQPIPSMPICFWADEKGERYRDSYFTDFPGIWRQGDLIRRTESGGYVISGRSDSTLNRFGIRIGTAEIYRAVESLNEINDSLIISLELPGAHFLMPLFVVLEEGVELDDVLKKKLSSTLAEQCSPRHVPDRIYAITEVPYTLTGKKLEVPVKKLLLGGSPDKVLNKGAIANPGTLEFFIELARAI